MKYLFTLIAFLCTITIYAIDFVYVGSYTVTTLTGADFKFKQTQFDVYAEYEGDKINALEITVEATGLSTNTSLIIEGKTIKAFNKSIRQLVESFSRYEIIDFSKIDHDLFRPIYDIKFPNVKLKGVMTDHFKDYESYDVVGTAIFSPRFYFFNNHKFYSIHVNSDVPGMRCSYLSNIPMLSLKGNKSNVYNYPLFTYSYQQSLMQFGSLEDLETLVRLTDTDYIKGRIKKKIELESKQR